MSLLLGLIILALIRQDTCAPPSNAKAPGPAANPASGPAPKLTGDLAEWQNISASWCHQSNFSEAVIDDSYECYRLSRGDKVTDTFDENLFSY